jgi:thiol:disulfide interchange protein DsbA
MNQRISRSPVNWLLVTAMLALAACGSPEQATDTAPEVDVTVTELEEVVEVKESTTESNAELEALSGVAETEGLEAEAEETEEIVLNQIEASKAPAADETAWKYKEGEHYRRMTTSQGTSSPPGKIEVAEVFWYGCPHCYDFDPVLSKWEEQLPADVAFVRIPVIWNPTNQVHARLMYTAEALGVLDEAHGAIFATIHQNGNMLTDESDMIALFAEFDIDEATFLEAYQSFGVTSSVKRAENLTRRYGVRSVPVMIINGKYATDAPGVKSFVDIISVVDELVERERVNQ